MPSLHSHPQEQLEKEQKIEAMIESDNIYSTPTPTPGADATWLEVRELEAHMEEDKEYADVKKDLRTEIRNMRRKVRVIHRLDRFMHASIQLHYLSH